MFQAEPILALQAHASEGLTAFMVVVSALGGREVYLLLLLCLAFGVDLRKGILLAHLALWNGLVNDALKDRFDLPRPFAVDARVVRLDGGGAEPVPPGAAAAAGFWAPLPAEVVAGYRQQGDFSRGFPSGHVAAAVAIWGGIAALFAARRALRVWAALFVLLVAMSRMYLGRHFLAGVLAGFVEGSVMLTLALLLARGLGALEPAPPGGAVASGGRRAGWLAYLVLGPVLVAFLAGAAGASAVAGLNLAVVLLSWRGAPCDTAPLRLRAARVVLAASVYAALAAALQGLLAQLGERAAILGEAAGPLLLLGLGTWGSVRLARRLRLFPAAAPQL